MYEDLSRDVTNTLESIVSSVIVICKFLSLVLFIILIFIFKFFFRREKTNYE